MKREFERRLMPDSADNFQINTQEELNMAFDSGLTVLYQEIFAETPYEEKFEEDQIRCFFNDYVEKGKLWLGFDQGRIIGFSAGVPLEEEREIAEIAKEFGFEPETTWYFADLGVDKDYRRRGIGSELTKNLLESMPTSTVIMRTAENNVASQELNMGIGFEIIEGMRQEVGGYNPSSEPRSDNRIFLAYQK